MASAFATKFSSRRLIRKTTSELMRVKQRDGESLKNYMSRFNDAVLEVSTFDQAVGIAAVIFGLKHDRFRDSLIKHAATTFSEVNDRSLKFITAEEYALVQNPPPSKNQNPDWGDDNPSRKRMRVAQNRGPMLTSPSRFGRPNSTPPQQSAGKPPANWTPFNLPRELNNRGLSESRGRSLKESTIPQIDKKRKIDDAEWKNQPITFTSADLDTVVTPHNDPLVTSVMINNCEVQRVVVDTGSAPDIMYFHCFESLGLDLALLHKYDGPIYGFNNQPVPVEGVLTLHVAFGSGRTYVAPLVRFFVVKMASSFNIVIGRPTLTEIRAVVSQSHLCMKFPTPMGIATLRGNQEVARHCYITSITQPTKGKDKTPEIIPQRVPDSQQVMGVEIVDNQPEDETRAAPVEDVEEVLVDDRDLSRKTQIGTRLNPDEKAELIAFLRANNDVFAWTSADMLGIPTSVCQHKLSTYPLKKPVAQKRRLFGGERLQAIKEEILQKPECSGRLIKWAVELGEFEITFQQRSAIRAQALADFIVECTPCPSTSNPEPNDWTLYVDGASSSKGSGAGALLIVVDPVMVKYVALVAELKCKFQKFCLSKIPRVENEQADSLSKFASDSSLSSRSVFVEVLDEPSFTKPRVMEISTNPDTPSWTDSIVSFLRDGIVPEDRQEAMKLRKKASRYTLVDGVLYKRSFSLPLLRCLNPYEAEYALREVHEGVCWSHVGARTLAHKVLRHGYYWSNMYKDATYFVQKCPKCQFFAHLTHQPAEELTNLVAPWPFAQWGLDLLGPFVKGVNQFIPFC
ncbi:hypothetical protein SLEP1_g22854 [Rubroshorea leprosula]|uniref:Integrase zinc-binding domain-containing protein n=1 Tax=Rubroshorea leprosula TaxID=152421 RepID=A0AAV5JJB2_9ROSI|nr:hypothetical protein SLEP1_g22854 [Rubroshorea leprosula]